MGRLKKICVHGNLGVASCKECKSDNLRRWRANNPEKNRALYKAWLAIPGNKERKAELNRIARRKNYGIINPSGESKEGNCEICKRLAKPLHCDHNHFTGKFRGWLCFRCNTCLDWAIEYKKEIIQYLNQKRNNETRKERRSRLPVHDPM